MSRRTRSPRRHRRPSGRRGFFILFGWRTITTRQFRRPVRTACPACPAADAEMVGYVRRRWCTLFFLPVLPMDPADRGQRWTQCRRCGQTFDVPVDQFIDRPTAPRPRTFADTIVAYNDLREHPADGQRLLALLRMYEGLDEPAESVVRHFPAAFAAEPACADVLDRLRQPPDPA